MNRYGVFHLVWTEDWCHYEQTWWFQQALGQNQVIALGVYATPSVVYDLCHSALRFSPISPRLLAFLLLAILCACIVKMSTVHYIANQYTTFDPGYRHHWVWGTQSISVPFVRESWSVIPYWRRTCESKVGSAGPKCWYTFSNDKYHSGE